MGEIHFYLRKIHQIGRRTQERLLHPAFCPSFRADRIRLAGLSRARPGFRFVRPAPPIAQVLVCFRGAGRVWLEGSWRECRPGMAYLTPAGKFHAYEAGPDWEIGWVIYEPETAFLQLDGPRMVEADPRPLELALEGLHHEISTGGEPDLRERWGGLLQRQVERIAGGPGDRLRRLWQAVRDQPGAAWDLSRLARTAGMGAEQLRRVCRRETGRSPMQHLTRLRMEAAAGLLGREGEDRGGGGPGGVCERVRLFHRLQAASGADALPVPARGVETIRPARSGP